MCVHVYMHACVCVCVCVLCVCVSAVCVCVWCVCVCGVCMYVGLGSLCVGYCLILKHNMNYIMWHWSLPTYVLADAMCTLYGSMS